MKLTFTFGAGVPLSFLTKTEIVLLSPDVIVAPLLIPETVKLAGLGRVGFSVALYARMITHTELKRGQS